MACSALRSFRISRIAIAASLIKGAVVSRRRSMSDDSRRSRSLYSVTLFQSRWCFGYPALRLRSPERCFRRQLSRKALSTRAYGLVDFSTVLYTTPRSIRPVTRPPVSHRAASDTALQVVVSMLDVPLELRVPQRLRNEVLPMRPEWTSDLEFRIKLAAQMKCRFAKARPEPVFRYFSKATALASVANSSATMSRHGRIAAVCCEPPELWTARRRLTSDVIPA
jgi:hypothetical protein